jgi:hypothetical protein
MNNKIFVRLIFCLALIMPGCSKDVRVSPQSGQGEQGSVLGKAAGAAQQSAVSAGAKQISGVGFFDETDECNALSQGASYALKMTGGIVGCHFVFVDEFKCSPSGTYYEKGRELFVGTYNGETGRFWTTYNFEAKYEGCAVDGSFLGAEIFGRCQHPIVEGSGEGVFHGVTGRLDLRDDIEAGNYPYTGHLRWF